MITRHTRGSITWIDMESPTQEELRQVMEEFDIDPRIEEEIVTPTPYPLAVSFAHYLYLILHFPTTDVSGGARSQEVDFIVGKEFLITARYEVIEPIYGLHKVFEAEDLLELPETKDTAAELLERVLRRLYGAIREEVEDAAHMLERIEHDVFSGKEREMVHRISEIGRILLRFDTILARHMESLDSLLMELEKPAFFGKAFATHKAHIDAERDHVAALVTSHRAVVSEMRKTNDSLLSASQNEVIKTLSVLAFASFPLSFIAALFGMNITHLPFVDEPGAFWFIVGVMLLSVGAILGIFRIKRWW
jgi:Mg2+ and Co2+ transporter CorA